MAGGNKASNPFAENALALNTSSSFVRERIMETERMALIASPTPMSVNYQSEVINNVSYVSEDQFQKGLRDSANKARAQTLADLKNKPSTRASAGIR
jgi:hypothetical protein